MNYRAVAENGHHRVAKATNQGPRNDGETKIDTRFFGRAKATEARRHHGLLWISRS